MKTLKSIWAVLAGFLTVVILSVGTDVVLEATGVFPKPGAGTLSPSLLAVALIYRCIYTILGGYVTAWRAPARPLRHAIILGCIGTAAAIAGAIVAWHLSEHWYPLALVVTALPCTWLGGKLRKN